MAAQSDNDAPLRAIADTDIVEVEWTQLRELIKNKIDKNIELFMANPEKPPPPPWFAPIRMTSGNLKLPPFPTRPFTQYQPIEPPVSYMNLQQANQMKSYIYAQLDEFDVNPPFTIQRLCELCLEPQKQYKSVGKYLRAVEKTILVTSTWDSFPPLPEGGNATAPGIALISSSQSTPSTPMFSPIPFLHEDARRSKSRSPPPSPLTLASAGGAQPEPLEGPAIGMVDELDDPSPGHMSEHPVALTAVTTTSDGKGSKPFLGSLEQRFTKGETQQPGPSKDAQGDAMAHDENKENKS